MMKQILISIIVYMNVHLNRQNTIIFFQNFHMDNAMTPSLQNLDNLGHLDKPLPTSSCPRVY